MEKRTIVIERQGGKYSDNQDFQRISWVIAARSTDETRQNINGVAFSYGVAMATDGHRLHIACIDTEIPDGNYVIKSATKKIIVLESQDYVFPDVERVWRKRQGKYIKTVTTNGDPSRFIYETYNSGDLYNIKYLNDVYMPDTEMVIDIEPDHKRPAVFYNHTKDMAALLMPLMK